MATFKERFEELFGPTPDYDPVQIDELADTGRRRAIDIQDAAPTATPSAIPLPRPTGPAPERQGALSGLLKTGTTQLAEGALGGLEYLARQNEFTRGTDVEGFLNYGRERLQDYRNSIYRQMSPDVIDAKGREFLTLDPDRTIWRGSPLEVGESILYKLTEQIPMTLATLVPGGLMLRAGAGAKGITYLGASEAGLSLGFIQNDIADGIAELNDEQLAAESPRFAQLLQEMEPDAARSQFTAEAQGAAPVIGGILVGAVSAAAGRFLKPTLTGEVGGSFGQRFRRGAVSEGLIQEGPQESLEQIVSNIAAAAYDNDREALEGAAEAYFQGAVVGGPLGGVFAGALGRQEVAAPPGTPDAEPTSEPPQPAASFEEVFGEGGESPFIAPDAAEDDVNIDDPADPVAADVRAAISANIREDDLMGDLFAEQEAQQQRAADLARQEIEGRPAMPVDQQDLFPTAAPSEGPGVAVPPAPPAEPEQGVLPMRLPGERVRGGGTPILQESPRGARFPEQTEFPPLPPEDEPPGPPDGPAPPTQPRATQDMFEEDLPPREVARNEAAREAAAPTEGERAVREATADLPFEEGVEARATARGARTRSEAAERLVGEAGRQLDRERSSAISGFFPPDSYEFNDRKNAARYKEAWDDLVEVEIALEMQPKGVAGQRGTLTQRKNKIIKDLAAIRQLDQPRRTVERKVRVAKKVDTKTVRKLRRNAARIAQAIDTRTEDVLGEMPEMTRQQVDKLKPIDLDVMHEQAIRYLEGVDERFDAAEKRKTRSPSVKRKLILRALNKRRNREETASRSGGVSLATPTSRKGVKTDALTRVTQKADESREDTIKRETRAKKAYSVVRGKIKLGTQRLDQLEVERDPEGELTEDGRNALLGRAYLSQLLQVAEAAVNASQSDLASIDFADRLAKAIDDAMDLRAEGLAGMMRAQQRIMDKAAGLKEGPAKRAAAVLEQNAKLMSQQRAMERRAKQKGDGVWQAMVGPVMAKLNNSYFAGKPYVPTVEEMQGLQWALREWRKDIPKGYRENFYTPIRSSLTRFGFKFDEDTGDLVVEVDEETGAVAYTPSEGVLKNNMAFDDKASDTREVEYNPPAARGQSAEQFNKRRPEARIDTDEVSMRYSANRHVRGTSLLSAFRKIIDNKKTTLRRMIDAERRLLADLRQSGLLRGSTSGAIVTVDIPGFKNISYRRIEPDLDSRAINKSEARDRVQATFRDYYTQEIKRFREAAAEGARDLSGTETVSDMTVGWKPRPDQPFKDQQNFGDLTGFYVEDNVLELQDRELSEHGSEIEAAGSTLGDMLMQGNANGDSVLAMLVEQLPANSVYGVAARLLKKYGFSDVSVTYAARDEMGPRTLGKWSPSQRTVFLNYDLLQGRAQPEQRAVHTVLHELVHAGTQQSIRMNTELRVNLERLRNEARRQYRLKYGPEAQLPYGLMEGTPVDEFVAEAFTNPEFQRVAKDVQITPEVQFWDAFKAFVRRVLGWVRGFEANALDVVMELESELFQFADRTDAALPDLNLDVPLQSVVQPWWDKANQSYSIEQRARDMASRFGRGKFLHSLLTMRQLREMYAKYFPENQLGKYMDAFNARNSKNAELMQLPEKMSREWTQLQEQNPEATLEFSRVATESTLNKVDPTLPYSHERNKSANEDKYREMKRRYDALPESHKEMWGKVTKFYSDSLRRETNLMMLNAIRGVVTQGGKVNMPLDTFRRKYNVDNIQKFQTAEQIKDEFGEFLGDNADNLVSTIQQIASVPGLQEGVYFPLMRYGDHAVFMERKGEKTYYADSKEANAAAAKLRAEDPTLTVEVSREQDGRYWVRSTVREFVTAESAFEVEQERDRLLKEYPDGRVGDVGLKLEKNQDAAINTNQALSSILKTLDNNPAAQQAIKQFYLRSLADSSFRKRELARKRRRGVNYDLQHRNFANYAKQSAYYQAQLEFGWQMGQALSDMEQYVQNRVAAEEAPERSRMTTEELQNVYNNLKKRDEMTVDPQEVSNIARKGVALTQFYMLTSASYHIINMSQPWMVTLPTMAGKFGWGSTFSAMKAAQARVAPTLRAESVESWFGAKTIKSDVAAEKAFGVFDRLREDIQKNDPRADEHLEMLDELRKTHVLEVSPLTELREVADGTKSLGGRVIDASRVMSHIVEVNNRVLTAIAAYDLMYERELENGASVQSAKETATRYAEDMVSQTQFDYSTANKPPIFQRYPLMFQFMQWSQHIYAHLVRTTAGAMRGDAEARRALFGVLGTHAAVGGIIGTALQPIKMAFGLAMMALGDDDEPYTLANAMSGATFDRVMASSTNELLGTTASTILTRGVPAALGADLSTRMSLGTLYFIDVRPDTPESVAGSLALSFGGAFVNQMGTFYRGTQHLASGDYQKAVESFTPKLFRDIVRAGRLASDGLVNNAGDTVVSTADLSFLDVALQAVGFTPTTTTQFYEGQAAIKDVERYVRQRKSKLLKDFRTSDDRAAVLREVQEFNRAYPQEAITRSALLRNLQSQAERESQYKRYGAAIDDRKAALYRGYGEPYR